MATLGQLGVNGLMAVNSWIGIINSNLKGASRTAYKPTRPSFTDGVVETLNSRIQLPAPTLNVQATSLEWAQGSIVNSNSRANFALQGQGFFVLTDGIRYYLSRDGEFHWDGQGFLVNSNGLRVVSSGQDYVRFARGDQSDLFDPNGQSQELARYGDKSLMVVDVANRDGLRFSRYGSTVFEVDGDLPLRVRNSFDDSMDGLTFIYRDPKQRTYVDVPNDVGFVPATAPGGSDFSINFGGNGTMNYAATTGTPFDPAVNTIQDVVSAINLYGTSNNAAVSATYNAGSDRIEIVNVPEPKVVDPGFGSGNFTIDFGRANLFTFHGFSPGVTTIQSVLDEINRFALVNNYNITAAYNDVTDQFTITNTIVGPGNNQIRFDGLNGRAMANFMKLSDFIPSTGGGAQVATSATPIDRSPPSTNTFVDITAADVATMPIGDMIRPPAQISFFGANGPALATFFRVLGVTPDVAIDPATGFVGKRLLSSRDIDNSDILLADPALANRHSLDILAADVATRSFNAYITTTDTTVPVFDFSGPPATYSHDRQNGRVISDAGTTGHGLIAISQAQRTDAFELVLDYNLPVATRPTLLALHFGYDKPEQIDSGGFSLYYDPANGDLTLTQRGRDPNDPPTILATRPAGLPNNMTAGPHRLSAQLEPGGLFTISIDGAPAQVFNLSGFSQQQSGYISIGHQTGMLQIDHLYADFKGSMNTDVTGELASVGNTPYASVEVNHPLQDRPRTLIVQSALESSTASLTEYLPMLSLAQKVFSSLSKIISISQAVTDDINSLIR